MLTSISIKNFALIESLAIDFEAGFSTITGETGAGKSILLGALGLILGKRADLSSLKNQDEKCVVEAGFDISKYNLKDFFESNDLDFEPQTIIRREILPSGKSRAFVNDSPINLNELADLGSFLIDIHSQNQTRELSETETQFQIIDAVAENQDLVIAFHVLYSKLKKHQSEFNLLVAKAFDLKKESDYNGYLLTELFDAKLLPNEQQILESSFEQLNNVGTIAENFEKTIAIATNEQFGLSNQLLEVKNALQKNAAFSEVYESIYNRINSLLIEFSDIVLEVENIAETLSSDPAELEKVNQRLQLIYNLQQKHQVKAIEELLEIQNSLDQKMLDANDIDSQIQNLKLQVDQIIFDLDAIANQISENRATAIPVLSLKLTQILELLGMPNAQFNISIQPDTNFNTNGKDILSFLFSANKGGNFGLLKKTASGGEMSRIMLAAKAILSGYSNLPTIIFDEIDTGVSGEIANKMAAIMKKMSHKMQVFSITHLPQIAAKGNVQFKVFKTTSDNQTRTELKLLSTKERILEIAEMLSGASPSESAINHAKTLLN
jgi:DNA repair protein RecN (Recombination protein N)